MCLIEWVLNFFETKWRLSQPQELFYLHMTPYRRDIVVVKTMVQDLLDMDRNEETVLYDFAEIQKSTDLIVPCYW